MTEPFPRWKAYGYPLLTLLVPGGGHFALGKRGRAAAFLLIVLSMFAFGLALGGGLFAFTGGNWLYRLAALGEAGGGLLYLVGRIAGWGVVDQARVTQVMFGCGSTCLVTAGLMNMLLIMDAFDIAVGRKP